jgi:hypothetical protein
MHRILALIALVAFAIGSSAAYAGGGCSSGEIAGTTPKQTVASVDGGITPIPVPAGSGS